MYYPYYTVCFFLQINVKKKHWFCISKWQVKMARRKRRKRRRLKWWHLTSITCPLPWCWFVNLQYYRCFWHRGLIFQGTMNAWKKEYHWFLKTPIRRSKKNQTKPLWSSCIGDVVVLIVFPDACQLQPPFFFFKMKVADLGQQKWRFCDRDLFGMIKWPEIKGCWPPTIGYQKVTLPETNSQFVPENGWLEYHPFPFWGKRRIFMCYVLLNFQGVRIPKLQVFTFSMGKRFPNPPLTDDFASGWCDFWPRTSDKW